MLELEICYSCSLNILALLIVLRHSSMAFRFGRILRAMQNGFSEGFALGIHFWLVWIMLLVYFLCFSLLGGIIIGLFRLVQNDFYSQPTQSSFWMCNTFAFILPFLSSLTAYGYRTYELNKQTPNRQLSLEAVMGDYSFRKSVSLNLLTAQYSLVQGFLIGVILVSFFDLTFIYYFAGISRLWIPMHWCAWVLVGFISILLLFQCRIFFEARVLKIRNLLAKSKYFDPKLDS